MKNNIAITTVLALIIGLLGGYAFGTMTTGNYYERMSNDHVDTMRDHKSARSAAQNNDADMDHMMMNMAERMEGKTGDELDRIFLEDMIVHHQGAIDMAEVLAKETKRPELQKMASDIIEVQSAEIAMMETWLTDWYGKGTENSAMPPSVQ